MVVDVVSVVVVVIIILVMLCQKSEYDSIMLFGGALAPICCAPIEGVGRRRQKQTSTKAIARQATASDELVLLNLRRPRTVERTVEPLGWA